MQVQEKLSRILLRLNIRIYAIEQNKLMINKKWERKKWKQGVKSDMYLTKIVHESHFVVPCARLSEFKKAI